MILAILGFFLFLELLDRLRLLPLFYFFKLFGFVNIIRKLNNLYNFIFQENAKSKKI